MKLAFLAGLFFIYVGIGLSYKVPDGTSASKHENSPLSQPISQGEVHGVTGTDGLYGEVKSRGFKRKLEIHRRTLKGHPGKGAYGGANVVHRPRQSRSAASLSAKPSFVSTTMLLIIMAFFISQVTY